MPKILLIISKFIQKTLFCVFNSSSEITSKKIQPKVLPSQDVSKIDSKLPRLDQPTTSSSSAKYFCMNCKKCDECLNQVEKEKQNKKEQAEFKSNLDALNYLAFIFLFLFILCSNTTIWTLMVN